MAVTEPIHANKSIEVRFRNDKTSTGVVLVKAGWVPKDGHDLPSIPSVIVAPATTDGFKTTVPVFTDVRRLSITVSLDDGEAGVLEVLENNAEHTLELVEETTTFEMPVNP